MPGATEVTSMKRSIRKVPCRCLILACLLPAGPEHTELSALNG